MKKLQKLKPGDRVAVLSPSFGAPGRWPHVYELALQRLRENFGLIPVEYPTTRMVNASTTERARDLIAAFSDKNISAVISTIGGDDQVTYINSLPTGPFKRNPKPFFGFSDNSHFSNFLWLQGVPSFYGGSLFTQFAMQGEMDEFTVKYLRLALFGEDTVNLESSPVRNDCGYDWGDIESLTQKREYEQNDGWHWNGLGTVQGITWGGCLESLDEMMRVGVSIPSLSQFENIILMTETSEELPSAQYVSRVYRAFGERGILKRVKGILVGRPKAEEFNARSTTPLKEAYRREQREAILQVVERYNPGIPIVQNMDFGHTDPQIPMPYGSRVAIDTESKSISIDF